MTEIMIYKRKNGSVKVDVNLADETVWLSMTQMVKLFGRDKPVISRHLNNIFKTNELSKNSVVAKFATTASNGKNYQVDHYNLMLDSRKPMWLNPTFGKPNEQQHEKR